ncbi:hypothetical protein PV10_00465 [Exophiala mesophila]|uniref:Uncharacterized protein n=1 Tax=Exophiala mesophila TaxID=212818 RepID=A0A0D1Y7E2_EXOME|nr:uncharacterized protein PV10_00465 [Exophiala mesophila]KIV96626.1 hypothetical protein PV10_00465 [Exophiala mesophila]
MAANQSTLLKQWSRIIQAWPKDKLRPDSVSFQTVMQARINKLGAPAVAATNAKANDTPTAQASPSAPVNEQKEMRQIKALDALLQNRFATMYPFPNAVRYPQSMPTHYDDVIKEMDEAPTRSRFTAFMNRIKGSLRLS